MGRRLIRRIQKSMSTYPTEDLMEIYKKHDRRRWSEEAFEAIKRTLNDRGEIVPEQNEPIYPDKKQQLSNDFSVDNIFTELFSDGFVGLLNKGPLGWIIFGLAAGFLYGVLNILTTM